MKKGIFKIIKRTPIIAHRGCWDKSIPENSMPAFKKALHKGYGIELDVHLTKDKQIVVFHDHKLKRMCKTDGIIEDMKLSEIKNLNLKNTTYKIPTLKEVFDLINSALPIFIELKCNNNSIELADALIKLTADYCGDFVFIGFDEKAIKYLKNKGYTVCISNFTTPKIPSRDFMPDAMLTNILFTPKTEKKLKFYPPFISWTISTPLQRYFAKKCCPSAIYNTNKFKDLK